MEHPVLHSKFQVQRKPSETSSADSALPGCPVLGCCLAAPSSVSSSFASSPPLSPCSAAAPSSAGAPSVSRFSFFSACSTSALPSLFPHPFPMESSSPSAAVRSAAFTLRSNDSVSATSFNDVFSSFPTAILFQLASFLYPVDVNNLLATCTCWRSLCTVGLQPLWREFVNRNFGRKYENYVAFTGDNDWRTLYIKIACFISNLKRGNAKQRRFPRLLLPPVSNTYEGSLAMTTDCTRLLWENGNVLQCLDVDVGKELWRVDLAEFRSKGRNDSKSSPGSNNDSSASNTSHSRTSNTGRNTFYSRASSVVIGRSKVFLHLEHQVYVYRLSDGTFITTLCVPSEEGKGSAAFMGNNMPLDVSLRNDHFTFLTKTTLFVFHSESLKLLYKIQHRELTPAIDTCEDIDFCWAGNRCCASVECSGYAAENAFTEVSCSERALLHSVCEVPSIAARISAANEKVFSVRGNLPGSMHTCAPDYISPPGTASTQTTRMREASTFPHTVERVHDKGKRHCEEGFAPHWGCDFTCAGRTDDTSSGSPFSPDNSCSPTDCHSCLAELGAELRLHLEEHAHRADCFECTYGKTAPFSNSRLFGNSVRTSRRSCRCIPAADELCGEQTPGVKGAGPSGHSSISYRDDNKRGSATEDRLPFEVCVHRCETRESTTDLVERNTALRSGQTRRSFTALTPTGSRESTEAHLCPANLPLDETNALFADRIPRSQTTRSAQERASPARDLHPGGDDVYTSAPSRCDRGSSGFTDVEANRLLSLTSKTEVIWGHVVACKTPRCCGRVKNQKRHNRECFECGVNKLSFRPRCQQSCRHIVTWLVKRSKTIKVWDIRDGASICTLHAHNAPIQKVRHVMNWKEITEYFLASLDVAGVVKIWGSGGTGLFCLQELQPEQNSCVFRMSFSPTHLATMSKESAGSDVVVTIWNFDQEKAASATQRVHRQRTISQKSSIQVISGKATRCSKVGNSCTTSSRRSTYTRNGETSQGVARHFDMRLKIGGAQCPNKGAKNSDSAHRSAAPLDRGMCNRASDNRDTGKSCHTVSPSATAFKYGEEDVLPQHTNTFCPGAQRPSANQRVHRSPAAWDSEREFQCREFSRQAGSSLLHPALQYSCSEVAIDPEDPSPHVKQAYLLDTRSTATVTEGAENSSSCESTGRTRRSSEHFDRVSEGSTGTKGNTNDYRRPLVSFSGSRVGASQASHERLWPRGAPGSTEASVAGVSETTYRQRARTWCPRSTTTKGKSNGTTKPSKVPPQAAFAGFLPHSAAGLCGASATPPETERSHVVGQLLQSPSQKPSAEQVSEPETLTGSSLREEPAVGEQQTPSPQGKVPATIRYNTPPTEEVLVVLEKEASFSAGVTAYYADFIDGQLLALWHFTVSPSSRDHSAFQYSLSDWKIYDCLHKVKNHHGTALVKNKQVQQQQPHAEPLQSSRRPPAAERASAPTVNPHTAEVGIAYMANQREATSVGERRIEATSKIPVFCMSNRGDVWTLLDWKCLSFEPQGDVTVFDFCPMSDQKLHLKGGNT